MATDFNSTGHHIPRHHLGDSMNSEELKRLHSERVDSAFAQRIWNDAIDSCFPAIVAKLEAAQRLRLCIKAWIESVPEYSQLAKNLEEALAAFDKETA